MQTLPLCCGERANFYRMNWQKDFGAHFAFLEEARFAKNRRKTRNGPKNVFLVDLSLKKHQQQPKKNRSLEISVIDLSFEFHSLPNREPSPLGG